MKIFIHQQSGGIHQDDIAVIFLNKEFTFDKYVQSVKLPEPQALVEANEIVTISGWGLSSPNEKPTTLLKFANISVVSNYICNNIYSGIITDRMMCAKTNFGRVGPTSGDFGGPLSYNGTLVGIISWTTESGSIIYPTVFTRVSHYIDWINKIVG